MNEIKIEKNIPAPHGYETSGNYKYPFCDMEIGDSFFVESKNGRIEGLRTALLMAGRSYKLRTNLSQVKYKTKVENNGVRIWRVK